MSDVGNFPARVALRDVDTNQEFVFANDSPTDYDKIWRVVGPPQTGDESFGIKYQPTRDGNSEHIVHVASGRLFRARADMLVIPLLPGDVTTTVRVRDRWRYGDPEE